MKRITTILLFLIALTVNGQIGINNSNPSAILDVNGDVRVDNNLFLEDPGDNTQIRGSKLLVSLTSGEMVKYDITQSKYGPINYTEFVFRNLSKDGLQDYDTKISTDEYIVTVQGFYYLEAGTGDTDVMTNSNITDDNIEGHQIYAYKNPVTNTWFLRAFINNAEFRTRLSGSFGGTPVDMYLNLIIYRRGFISKELTPISVDMANLETGVAPLPNGF